VNFRANKFAQANVLSNRNGNLLTAPLNVAADSIDCSSALWRRLTIAGADEAAGFAGWNLRSRASQLSSATFGVKIYDH